MSAERRHARTLFEAKLALEAEDFLLFLLLLCGGGGGDCWVVALDVLVECLAETVRPGAGCAFVAQARVLLHVLS